MEKFEKVSILSHIFFWHRGFDILFDHRGIDIHSVKILATIKAIFFKCIVRAVQGNTERIMLCYPYVKVIAKCPAKIGKCESNELNSLLFQPILSIFSSVPSFDVVIYVQYSPFACVNTYVCK